MGQGGMFGFKIMLAVAVAAVLVVSGHIGGSTEVVSAQGATEPDKNEVKDHRIESRRYQLDWYGSLREAEEMSKFLEAAWPKLKDFFGCEPAIAGNTKLRFRVFRDTQALVDEYRREQNLIVAAGTEHILELSNRTVYLSKSRIGVPQFTTEELQRRILFSATSQFHHVARKRTKLFDVNWYLNSIPNAVSQSYSFEDSIYIAVVPFAHTGFVKLVQALEHFKQHGLDLEERVKGTSSTDDGVYEALFIWLYSHSPESKKKLHRFLNRVDAGTPIDAAFRSEIGQYEKVKKEFVDWLGEVQPKATGYGGGSLPAGFGEIILKAAGGNGKVKHTSVMTDQSVDWFEASLDTPKGGLPRAGLVLSYVQGQAFTIAYFNKDGEVEAAHFSTNVSSKPLMDAPLKPAAARNKNRRVMRAEYKEGKVTLKVDGKELFTIESPAGAMGLVSLDTVTVRFENISFPGFREPPAKGARRGK